MTVCLARQAGVAAPDVASLREQRRVPVAVPSHEEIGIVQPQFWTSHTPLELQSGAVLSEWTLAYETYGELNRTRDNAILIMHALSGDAHVAGRHQPDDRKPGWWHAMVGPGRVFDTEQFFVICANVLGGCRGSTGPGSLNPATGKPYRLSFPVVTVPDMVAAQVRLLDHLGISEVHAAIGGSMGGMQVIELAVNHPDRVRLAMPLATTARSNAQAIAWTSIGRRAIVNDPEWAAGEYTRQPASGLALARMVAHMTYLSEERLEARFGRNLQEQGGLHYELEREFAVESYLEYQGRSFVERFDANSYLYITKAMDYWDVTRGSEPLAAAFARARCRWLVASFTSDWLYPPAQSEQIVSAITDAGGAVDYYPFVSALGHDAFLLEDALLTPVLRAALLD